MFDIHCKACGRHQLISPSQVNALINDDEGIAVIYTCSCGEMGALRTGAAHTDAEARKQAVAG